MSQPTFDRGSAPEQSQAGLAGVLAACIDQLCQPDVVWLYGSRARGDANAASDYDLAVARTLADGNVDLDELAGRVAAAHGVAVSVIDINRVPAPLAYNVISEGRVLCCRSDLRLRAEQQRIWSLWEEYRYQHEQHRPTS